MKIEIIVLGEIRVKKKALLSGVLVLNRQPPPRCYITGVTNGIQ